MSGWRSALPGSVQQGLAVESHTLSECKREREVCFSREKKAHETGQVLPQELSYTHAQWSLLREWAAVTCPRRVR